MDVQEMVSPEECYKISCKNYPSEFILDKNVAKEYFRQFGKLKRLTFKPKLRICTVEYLLRDGYLNALNNAGEHNGTIFKVSVEKSPEKKKKRKNEPNWGTTDEVTSELAAMAGHAFQGYNIPEDSSEMSGGTTKIEKVTKIKRTWATETPLKAKRKSNIKEKPPQKADVGEIPRHVELINVIKSQTTTLEDKYKVLDARDKLFRIKLKKRATLKSSPTVGTCPDMCPEKERLMRETKHQVALYEQEDSGRSMDPSKAIKQYSRSSADQEFPLPHELRPVFVLQMTMAYLMHDIIDMCESNDVNLAEWYHFLWDRTRGIRKDITQQELCSQGAVELIEQCARFHIHCSARLVAEDPSVFDQKINTENLTKCLQSLKYMYQDLQLKEERCPNEAEFRAYIILLNLNDGNFMWEVQELRQEIQKSKEIKFALEVHSALDKNNYVKFFKLVYSTTYLNACILMRYFVQVRITALKTLMKCYTSRAFRSVYPLGELGRLLAFDDIESTTDFVRTYGLSINEENTHIVLDKNTFTLPEIPYALDRSLNVVESKRECSVGRIVCGKEMPAKLFENHVLQESFDQRGYLMFQDMLEESDFAETEMGVAETLGKTNQTAAVSNIHRQPAKESFSSKAKKERAPMKRPPSGFFAQKSRDVAQSIFGSTMDSPQNSMDLDSKDEIDSNPITAEVFATPNVEPMESVPIFTEPKKGGFHFDLPEIDAAAQKEPMPVQESRDVPKEDTFKVDWEAIQREKERRRIQEAWERELKEEMEREEERLRIIKRKRQEEELKRRIEEMRREEERKKDLEIEKSVKSVLTRVVREVEDKIRRERLRQIREQMKKRTLLRMVEKWRKIVSANNRKRKAMDCSPVWISTKTPEQSARELYTTSQDLTLSLSKRYKHGMANDIESREEAKINKINLYRLTYKTLNQRFFDLKGVLQKNVFWKVQVSLPDHYELPNGLTRIEDTLREAFQWEDSNGSLVAVQQIVVNAMQSVTYCVERQRGLYARQADSNGIIFVAKDFNPLLQQRILRNLEDIGIFTAIPIVVILQEYDEDDSYFRRLVEQNVLSDYVILVQRLTPANLVGSVEQGLTFLASKVEKPPPLELDTLESFLEKRLCMEVWKRANSFGKWNSAYKSCLRNPNVVVNLYNEGLSQLRKIALDKSCFEYPSFPEIFKPHLRSEIPDCLPCGYCYFPKFWKSEAYFSKLERIFKSFELPKWTDEWPPSSEINLEVNVSKYCTRVFTEPEKPFYKVMSVLLRDVDPNVDFKNVSKASWTDVIEVLALEKLRETKLSLCGTAFETKSIFNQFVVVYNVDTLDVYDKCDWFYLRNPMVKKFVEKKMREEIEIKDVRDDKLESKEVIDLDKTLSEATSKMKTLRNTSQAEKELAEFTKGLIDLADSMEVFKKISAKMHENLERAIAEN